MPAALLLALVWLLGGCNGLFFFPNQRLYWMPERFGLWHEEVTFEGTDGTRLHGWFLPAVGKRLGTIVHFHGNAANISNHIYAVRWLPRAGFAVLMFDYRGYGDSAGSADRAGLVQDGIAAIDYMRSRPEYEPGRLFVYGQSLGGAVAINSLARAGTEGVAALIVESTFHSYREVARMVMNETWLTWPFQYPVAYLFISDAYRPDADLPKLADIPFLVVHGSADRSVPVEAGRLLYEAFPGKDKQFWLVPGAGHIETFQPDRNPWRDKLVAYMKSRMPLEAPPGYRWQPRANAAPAASPGFAGAARTSRRP